MPHRLDPRRALAALAACAALALPAAAGADQDDQNGSEPSVSYYAPATREETPLSHMQARVLAFHVGERYGEVDVRDGNGHIWKMLIGGDMLVEGHTISCMDAPQPGYPINEVACPDWPDEIVLGRTLVTVTYWRDRLNYRPILIASKIAVTRAPFVP